MKNTFKENTEFEISSNNELYICSLENITLYENMLYIQKVIKRKFLWFNYTKIIWKHDYYILNKIDLEYDYITDKHIYNYNDVKNWLNEGINEYNLKKYNI